MSELRNRRPLAKEKTTTVSITKVESDVIEPNPRTVPKKRSIMTTINIFICQCLGIIAAIMLSGVTLVFLFAYMAILTPGCPSTLNRECNGQGVCVNGKCECNVLFSGKGCTDTQILGYDIVDNTQCFKRGFVLPTIVVADECKEYYDEDGVLRGGWLSPTCVNFITKARSAIVAAGNDMRKVPQAINVPSCSCKPGDNGITGTECNIEACPLDEDGTVCGGNGNTSVGIFSNYTDAGNGCQCSSLIGFYEEKYRSYFSNATYNYLLQNYYTQFTSLYCGLIVPIRDPVTNEPIPDQVLAFTPTDTYKCYCDYDMTGPVCTDGKCPISKQTRTICSGNGHPLYGYGYSEDTSVRSVRGVPCSLKCIEGYAPCGPDMCYSLDDTSPGLTADEYNNAYCASSNRCPRDKPLRCADGTCAPIPQRNSRNCALGYLNGAIDYSQFGVITTQYRCPNVTDLLTYEQCFQNQTVDDRVIGFSQTVSGGVLLNVTTGYKFAVNFTSPLVYFQFYTNFSQVLVENFNGDSKYFQDGGLVNGVFDYTDKVRWGDVKEWAMFMTTTDNVLYTLSPAPYNYSQETLVNSNFSVFRVVNQNTERYLKLSIVTSILVYDVIDVMDENADLLLSNGVLVSYNITETDGEGLTSLFWMNPYEDESILLTSEYCLSTPERCSWYVSLNEGNVRNLDSSAYICSTDIPPYLPVIIPSPCNYTLSELSERLPGVFYYWSTDILASADTDNVILTSLVTGYQFETPLDTVYNISISWRPSVGFEDRVESLIAISDVTFLTYTEGITFPCACQSGSFGANMSILNDAWWTDTNTKTVRGDNIEVLDYVLFASYDTGERVLRRGIVGAVDTTSDVLTIVDQKGVVLDEAYFSDARRLSPYEYLSGQNDDVSIVTPFRCPDGKLTDATIELVDVDVACNCTVNGFNNMFPTLDNPNDVYYNCTCQDPDVVSARSSFDCQCTTTDCICGYPANAEFVVSLLSAISLAMNGECRCLVYNGWQASGNVFFDQALNVDAFEYTFEFVAENIVDYIIVNFEECNGYEHFYISGGSSYFTSGDVSVDIEYYTDNIGLGIGSWVDTCQYYLTLEYDPNIVFTNITIITNSTYEMKNVTLSFMSLGFSIVEEDTYRSNKTHPIMNATSNTGDVDNVIVIGSSGWSSSGTLRENPVIMQISLSTSYYLNSYFIIFKSAGVVFGGFNIPLKGYLQGSRDNTRWYTLDEFSIFIDPTWEVNPYTDERYQVYRHIRAGYNETFNMYRVFTYGERLEVLYFDIFSNVTCNCLDSDPFLDDRFGVAVQVDSLDGLVNLTKQVEDYYFELSNLNRTLMIDCVSVDSCNVFNEDASQNGVCNDVIYQAALLGIKSQYELLETQYFSPNNISALTENYTYEGYEYTNDFGVEGISAVQFYTDMEAPLDEVALEAYYNLYLGGLTLYNESTGLYVYYMLRGTNDLVGVGSDTLRWKWIEGTINVMYSVYVDVYGDLIETGVACPAGQDVTDCGASARIPLLFPGLLCSPFDPLSEINTFFETRNENLFYRSQLLTTFNLITNSSNWYIYLENMKVPIKVPLMLLQGCGQQVCPKEAPFKCDNGGCAKNRRMCNNRYTCPGNGCVKMTDASEFGSYRCACKPGANGESCDFTDASPAVPELAPGKGGVPVSGQIMCGGPPPFRIKPPVRNLKPFYTIEEIEAINLQPKGSCAPASKFDIGYHCVQPQFAPFGQAVLLELKVPSSTLLPNSFDKIYGSCPCCRKSYHGGCLLLEDDVASRNVITRKPTWKTYFNPVTKKYESFPWKGICTYNELPYRCPEGQCAASRSDCAQLANQFPSGNNRGTCLSDGSYRCNPSYKTFIVNNEFSEQVRYPYTWDSEHNTTNPVAWVLNFNWRLFGPSQCLARDCSGNNCRVPLGCPTGTYELGFRDKKILCSNNNLCADNIYACYGSVNLTFPLECSGNGVKRIKDVTGEEYCECGTPVSPLLDITDASEIVQLKSNGFGGPNCDQYYADLNVPLYWSSWDYKNDKPYTSPITGEELPGKWVKGNIVMGPRPEDSVTWAKCCQGYPSLRLCPFTACRTLDTISCLTPEECLAYNPDAPLIYPCNGHGVARADGTCLCDFDRDAGTVYRPDYSQFDTNGCYLLKRCGVSRKSGNVCDSISQCEDPGAWMNPFPNVPYLEQQWLVGTGGLGMANNYTKLEMLDIAVFSFNAIVEYSLALIALAVILAEASYQGCVCYYPNSTFAERCCMVLNDKEYTYMESFNYPYFLNISAANSTYDSLFKGNVYPAGRDLYDYYFEQGDVVEITLQENETNINAIRVMSSGGANIMFLSSTGEQICPEVELIDYLIDSSYPIFNWNAGQLGGALSCGPLYTCVSGTTFPLYESVCGIKTDTDDCIAYRESSCLESGYIYWDVGSASLYPGCERVSDPDGCRCCRQTTPPQKVYDGRLYMHIMSGSTYIKKIRLYGDTEQALVAPLGLAQYLSEDLGYVSTCQDIRFFRSRLGADKSYYTTTGEPNVTFAMAREQCTYYGGYLAVGELGGDELTTIKNSIKSLQSVCGNIVKGSGKCWVEAKSLANTTMIPRHVVFDTPCDAWGCYEQTFFYTNNSQFNYSTPYFVGQGNITLFLQTVPLTTSYFGVWLDYYTSTYCNNKNACYKIDNGLDTNLGMWAKLRFTYSNGASLVYIFTTNPRLALNAPYFSQSSVRKLTGGYVPAGAAFTSGTLFPPLTSLNIAGNAASKGANIRSIAHEGGSYALMFQGLDMVFCNFKRGAGFLGYSKSNIIEALTRYYYPSRYPEYGTDSDSYFTQGGYVNNFYMIDYGDAEIRNYFADLCSQSSVSDTISSYNRITGGGASVNSAIKYTGIGVKYRFITENCAYYDKADMNIRINMNRTLNSAYYSSPVFEPGCYYDFNKGSEYGYSVSCADGRKFNAKVSHEAAYPPVMLYFEFGGCRTPVFVTKNTNTNNVYAPIHTSYVALNLVSDRLTTGTIGVNRLNGYIDFPYQPLFFNGDVFLGTLQRRPPASPGIRTMMGYLTNTTGNVISQTTPIYISSSNGLGMFQDMNWRYATNVDKCSKCYIMRSNTCYWDQQYYSEVLWKNMFVCPVPDIYIQVPGSTRRIISSYNVVGRASASIYIHQTLFIQNYTILPSPIVNWYMPECVAVTSKSIVLDFCNVTSNFICQYDYTKYSVVAGTQCDVCSPSTSVGGVPIPGITCLQDNALANSELYPYQHLIKRNYQLGTLSEFAASVNIDPDMFNFENVTLIVGYAKIWKKWEDCYCSRIGQTSINVAPELNWNCFCLKTVWPVNCGRQVDPRTNSIKRYCATKSEYCNIYLNDTEMQGPIMRSEDIPPLLRPVDSTLSYIDPTCGYNLELFTYNIMDKHGGPQTDLSLYQKIVFSGSEYIQLQVSEQIPRWYNGGKTPIDFKFEWDVVSTISGYYKAELCSLCVGAFMEIIIYPLNIEYTFPILYLSSNISLITDGLLHEYSVNFTVTESDTGSYELQGETFPLRVFKGIGMRFFNMDVGSMVTLYNPVVSTSDTRHECETREVPIWREPDLRIKDASPDRFCVLTEDEQEIYPESEIGECYCDPSTTGPACDSIATYSKYGKAACGGFGECLSYIQGPDGVYYQTMSGDECGTYMPVDLVSSKVYSDCKNINLGRYIFTLWTENAILDYPSVYVETIPLRGSSIFKLYEDNTSEEDYTQARASCNSQGMFMPYFFTLDEILQLIVETRTILPVFIGVDTPNSDYMEWPWENVDNGYFMFDPDIEYQAEVGACDSSTCAVVNFNNFAYFADITGTMGSTPSLLQDGNTNVETVASGTYTIVYSQNADLVVKVYLFGTVDVSLDPISCSAGVCEPWSLLSQSKTTVCRCPGRILTLTVTNSNVISEVQIFNTENDIYSSSYIYT